MGTQQVPEPAAPPAADDDAPEILQLHEALLALEISEADDPTILETHRLRRAVVEASVALERKQPR
jgi:hypothetical protein